MEERRVTGLIGIIANPASGKDIRRLVAHGSVFENHEKINIIRRALRGLDALGIRHVLAMGDAFGLITRARDGLEARLTVETLDLPITNTAQDSTEAARRRRLLFHRRTRQRVDGSRYGHQVRVRGWWRRRPPKDNGGSVHSGGWKRGRVRHYL